MSGYKFEQVLFVLVVVTAAVGVGRMVVGHLDGARRLGFSLELITSLATGCVVLSLCVGAIGFVRLDLVSMAALALVFSLAAIPGLLSLPWRTARAVVRAELAAARGDPLLALLWLSVGATAALGLTQGLAPPNDYDSLLYHLALPKYDVEMGRNTFAWDRAIGQLGFPALGGNLSRMALILAGDGAAQMLHGVIGFLGAAAVGLLARAMGYDTRVALGAALFYLGIRVLVWQMATVETDPVFAAYALLALVVYLHWRSHGGLGLCMLFGVLLGAAIHAKYLGFAVALAMVPLILYDLVRRQRAAWLEMTAASFVALGVVLPHALRNLAETGNPVYPLFVSIFNPQMRDYFGIASELGTGRGIWDLLIAPWSMSIMPLHYFDGMSLGAPYLLALAPLALLDREERRNIAPLLIFSGLYFVIWFSLLSQQVRFLLPTLGVAAVFAAAGCAAMWRSVQTRPVARAVFVAMIAGLALNQAMFVGIYGALRLPAALGLLSPATYHTRTPTMTGANYETCKYVTDHLRPGERFFSIAATFNSYYCPQAAAVYRYFPDEARWWITSDAPPAMGYDEFLARVERAQFRFFFVSKAIESRRDHVGREDGYRPNENVTAQSRVLQVDPKRVRFGTYLYPALSRLKPVAEDNLTAVYDGPAVIAALKANHPQKTATP